MVNRLKLLLVFLLISISCSSFASNTILKTLVIYDNYSSLQNDTANYKDKIVVKFKDKKLAAVLEDFIGKEIDQKLLSNIKTTTINYYKDLGFPFVIATFPEGQDVTSGQIKFFITKGKVGKIEAKGGRYFSNNYIVKSVNIKHGDLVCVNRIMDNISFLNRDPFRRIDVIYEQGKDVGETNILLQVQDRFPIKVYAMFDHNRYPVAGNYRQTYGAQIGSLFRHDHRAEAQLSFARNFKRWHCFSGNYFIPIHYRHILRFFGHYCETVPSHQDNSNIPEDSHIKGRDWQVGGRFHTLFDSIGVLKHELVVGFDFRRTNNFEDYGPQAIYDHKIDISQFMASYEGSFNWSFFNAAFALSIIVSPGHIGHFNNAICFSQERPRAKSTYTYQVLHFNIIKDIKGATLLLDGMFQYCYTYLMPTEEFAVGGHLSVRGYDENEVIGDKGGSLKLEIRTPPQKFISLKKCDNAFRAIVFMDFGFVTSADKNVIDSSTAVLWSFGPGARYDIKDHLNFYCDYGVQIKSVYGRLWGSDSKSRLHVGLSFNF